MDLRSCPTFGPIPAKLYKVLTRASCHVMLTVVKRMAANGLKRKSAENGASASAKKPFGHWSMGLKASMEDPALKVESDDKIVIIKDKYPKVIFC